MDQPLVSIIIPVYNAEAHLKEALDSAIGQTWPKLEIIVVDDGSTDGSLAIAKTYEAKGVKVIAQQNKGASAARNAGLREANGDLIQFLDADDILSTNKIQAQVKLLKGYPDHLAVCATMHFADGSDHLSVPTDHGWMQTGSDDPVDLLIKLYGGEFINPEYGGMVQPNAWLTPRTLIDKAGLWNEELTVDDDGEFFCRMVLASSGVKYSKDAVNYYRKFADNRNWSARKTYDACNDQLKATMLKVEHLTQATTDPRANMALSRLLWENTFNLYPYYPDLYRIARAKAEKLAPNIKYKPYKHGYNAALANLFGWRTIKYLQYIKQKIR